MKALFEKINQITNHFSVLDIGVLKFCLLALGILLGVYFSSFFENLIIILWVIFVLTWLYIVVKVFGLYWDKK